ncbi:hypothetical protein [Haloimpatiens lingqiaonensis]|uniref:hypothetical protein n=1 Tax=Haloimpatiens lingqiaonensis TaxID=1380675 RepID=UPI0010FCFD25|nr:hypothetical protein [Haloimpatiens lingqiaonensis]
MKIFKQENRKTLSNGCRVQAFSKYFGRRFKKIFGSGCSCICIFNFKHYFIMALFYKRLLKAKEFEDYHMNEKPTNRMGWIEEKAGVSLDEFEKK